MFAVLVAVQQEPLRLRLCGLLEEAGYHCYPAGTRERALFLLESFHIDLAIGQGAGAPLDAGALAAEIRAGMQALPLLLLAEENTLPAKERCFAAGADDCMPLPPEEGELLLRVGALLRRAGRASRRQLQVGGLRLDYDALCVTTPREKMVLPKREMRLLMRLLSAPGTTLGRGQLLAELWGMDAQVDARIVDVLIRRLRKRFSGYSDFCIVTVRGLGYRAEVPPGR